MFSSIRMRLTAWYVVLLTIILAVFGTFVSLMMNRSLYERLDRRLENTAGVMASSLTHEIEEHKGQEKGEEMFAMVLATVHTETFPDNAIAVFQNARVIGRKPAAKGGDPLTVPRQAQPLGTAVYRSQAGWRIVEKRARVIGVAEPYTFAVAEPEAATLAELSRVRASILLAIPLALVLAAAGGWWMARKSLSPVVAMSRTVDDITASNLDRRIETANPRDELGQLGATFNRLLDRLERAFEQQRQFMADASHELRTPVSIAQTASELALVEAHRPEPEYRQALTTIHNQMRRLTRLVQDMFLLARADAGPLPLQPESLYLDELVAEVVRDAGVLAQAKKICLQVHGLVETPFHGDDMLLRRLLMALLDNSFQHTPAGGQVSVGFARTDALCRIQVRDTGCGIPGADRPRIFERFYRAEKSRSRKNGTQSGAGLGLAIGRTIAAAHGGGLELVATGPEGSTFEISLPLAG